MEAKEQRISYKIVITKTEHDVPFIDKNWKKLVDEPDEEHNDIYGYVETETTRNVDIEVFSQTLDKLDLAKLVVIINS